MASPRSHHFLPEEDDSKTVGIQFGLRRQKKNFDPNEKKHLPKSRVEKPEWDDEGAAPEIIESDVLFVLQFGDVGVRIYYTADLDVMKRR